MTEAGAVRPAGVERVLVDDPADPRLAAFTRMTDEALRRVREGPGGDLAGIFISEGRSVTERALEAGLVPEAVLVSSTLVQTLPALPPGTRVFVGSPALVEAVTGYHIHRGFLGAFRRPAPRSLPEVLALSRRLVVTENVTDPTNLGAMLRSAAALGMDALLLDPTSCDPYYRRVLRVSMGTVFSLPHSRLRHLPEGLLPLRRAGFRLVGLVTDSGAKPLSQTTPGERTALILGAEGPGLSGATRDSVDELVRIPMRPGIDSLNVAAAAAIAAYVVGGLDRA